MPKPTAAGSPGPELWRPPADLRATAEPAAILGWDAEHLTRLRYLLHQEPHVRRLEYNQYGDGADTIAETAMAEERE